MVVVVLVRFLLSSIIDRSSLLNAGVVTLPFDLGFRWEAKNALHSLSRKRKSIDVHPAYTKHGAYLILRTLPPSLRAQILRMSSPFLTLRTAPQTSSLASAN